MKFDNDKPIYIQIMDYMREQIVSGELKPGAKIMAVRELALEMATNPNTVQRALQSLEAEAVVETKRGLGRFVTEDESLIRDLRQQLLATQIEAFMNSMSRLGVTDDEIVAQIKKTRSGGADK